MKKILSCFRAYYHYYNKNSMQAYHQNKKSKTKKKSREGDLSLLSRMIRSGLLYIRINRSMIWNIGKYSLVLIVLGHLLLRGANGILSKNSSSKHNNNLPSSLTSDATSVLVPPGQCQFTKKFTSAKLLQRWKISSTTSVLRFELPTPDKSLQLSTCACLLAKGEHVGTEDNEDIIRPYTPISTNAQIGSFDLLVKDYGVNLSNHLCSGMSVGDTISFSHIPFNIKIQAPEFLKKYKKIGMIVGGTGITPMIQALHAILGEEKDNIVEEVVLLYGSKSKSEILGKELLDSWSEKYGNRFTVVHALSDEKRVPSSNDYYGGRIDEALIMKYLPPPIDDDCIIFVCGPPAMYDTFSGPRTSKELDGVLKDMGYNEQQVYKF